MEVRRDPLAAGDILITVVDQNARHGARMTEWNARRLCALLAHMLGIKLSAADAKKIEL